MNFFSFLVELVIMGLKDRFEEAARRNDVKAIVLTGNFFFMIVGLFRTVV